MGVREGSAVIHRLSKIKQNALKYAPHLTLLKIL